MFLDRPQTQTCLGPREWHEPQKAGITPLHSCCGPLPGTCSRIGAQEHKWCPGKKERINGTQSSGFWKVDISFASKLAFSRLEPARREEGQPRVGGGQTPHTWKAGGRKAGGGHQSRLALVPVGNPANFSRMWGLAVHTCALPPSPLAPGLPCRAYPVQQYPCRTKAAAAIMHMIMNNLDPAVAQVTPGAPKQGQRCPVEL